MPLKPRKQLAATCVAVVVLVLAAGLWLGGHPAHLPGFLDDVFVEDHQTRVVDEAIRRIQSDYYRPVSRGELSDASIKGAIASLKDRFSRYLDPKEFHEFSSPPHFTGIGVEVTPDPRGLLIARVFDSSPALRAGLKAGELIVAVNGRDLHGVAPDAAKNMIRGRPGTDV